MQPQPRHFSSKKTIVCLQPKLSQNIFKSHLFSKLLGHLKHIPASPHNYVCIWVTNSSPWWSHPRKYNTSLPTSFMALSQCLTFLRNRILILSWICSFEILTQSRKPGPIDWEFSFHLPMCSVACTGHKLHTQMCIHVCTWSCLHIFIQHIVFNVFVYSRQGSFV